MVKQRTKSQNVRIRVSIVPGRIGREIRVVPFLVKNSLFSRSFHLRAKVAFDDERGGVLRLRNDDRSRENRGKCVDKGYSCENLFSHHEIPNFSQL